MDADYTKRRRESEKSLREKRWSMNSQRLEEIVAELMKPISDVRRSFDTDLSALLEEYLTEAGLRALEESEEPGAGVIDTAPNFVELALLLQQSASIYSRKVDFLYQHVLDVSDSLHNSTQETSTTQAEEPQTPSSRRKRRSSAGGAGDFSPIELTASTGARRDAAARPPPTLPRGYLELEPRVMHATDAPLLDYAGEPIGLMTDFQVTWRLQDGLLVDELQVAASEGCAGAEGGGRLRAVPLTELQAAIAAAAPPDLPPPPPSPEPEPPHSPHSPDSPHTPLSPPNLLKPELESRPVACSTPLVPVKRERKRRSDVRLEDLAGAGKMLISAEVRRKLARAQEFALPQQWITRVIAARKEHVLSVRKRLRALDVTEFRGFEGTDSTDIGGFPGWSISEAACATGAAGELARRPRADSDDDGFFDQSSTGDSDDSAALATLTTLTTSVAVDAVGSAEWAAWRDSVVARAAESAARSFSDVRAAGDAVLRAAAALPSSSRAPCDALLAATVQHPADVSRMFLATLFLANAGNLEIVQGAPLTLNSFSVRLLSADQRRLDAFTADLPRWLLLRELIRLLCSRNGCRPEFSLPGNLPFNINYLALDGLGGVVLFS